MELRDNIIGIKGIGEKTLPLYHKIGIENVDDLIHYYPRDYIQYENLTTLNNDCEDNICAFTAIVMKRPLVKKYKKISVTSATLNASGVLVSATWFRMPYLDKSLVPGNRYVFRGKILPEGDHYKVEQAQIFSVEAYAAIEGKIAPVYGLTKGLSNNSLTKSIKAAFNNVDESEYENGLYDIHFPTDYDNLYNARKNLVFDEFILFILRLRLLKQENDIAGNNYNIIEVAQCDRIIEKLPYKLTNAQVRVWNEIKNDLVRDKSMSRLVQGDVGSGKTILAVLSAVMVASNGYQVAVMAPTEILAQQHFRLFQELINENNLDIEVSILTGSIPESARKNIRKNIESGMTKIIIGTHALFQEKVVYSNLALVITDEQHRFGVSQRKLLSQKNENDSVHVLVMSATPIPRTLAIILYGDLSVSVIDEVPAHKLPIKNAIVNESYRAKEYEFIIKEIAEGHQVYIICPLVEESEGVNAKDVNSYTDELRSILPETINVGKLHGRMKPKDKQKVMDDFLNNDIQVLVSTTVVEVGVNVPNATVMVIENAERFGLAQLHQLRGRIGRGNAQSYCIFMCGSKNEHTMQRMEVLKKTNDGFKIAEEDLKQRGPGDLFGIRQSGDMQFKLADIFTDSDVLKKAAIEVDRILNEDPNLEKDENRMLKKHLDNFVFGNEIGKTI